MRSGVPELEGIHVWPVPRPQAIVVEDTNSRILPDGNVESSYDIASSRARDGIDLQAA